eukprot:6111953-Prymnesium_polylepis.1
MVTQSSCWVAASCDTTLAHSADSCDADCPPDACETRESTLDAAPLAAVTALHDVKTEPVVKVAERQRQPVERAHVRLDAAEEGGRVAKKAVDAAERLLDGGHRGGAGDGADGEEDDDDDATEHAARAHPHARPAAVRLVRVLAAPVRAAARDPQRSAAADGRDDGEDDGEHHRREHALDVRLQPVVSAAIHHAVERGAGGARRTNDLEQRVGPVRRAGVGPGDGQDGQVEERLADRRAVRVGPRELGLVR